MTTLSSFCTEGDWTAFRVHRIKRPDTDSITINLNHHLHIDSVLQCGSKELRHAWMSISSNKSPLKSDSWRNNPVIALRCTRPGICNYLFSLDLDLGTVVMRGDSSFWGFSFDNSCQGAEYLRSVKKRW